MIEPEQLGAAVAQASVGRAAPGGRRALGRRHGRRVRRARIHDVLLLPLLRLHALRGGPPTSSAAAGSMNDSPPCDFFVSPSVVVVN